LRRLSVLLVSITLFLCIQLSIAGEERESPQRIPFETVVYCHNPNLKGMLYLPTGKGPFPVMIYNHDSSPRFRRYVWLVEPFNSRGYALFIPWRSGAGLSNDAERADPDLANLSGDAKTWRYIENQELDVLAAVEWVKRQPWADNKRMAMMGNSYGGIMTVLTAAHDTGIKAFVPTAPGALSWRNSASIRQGLMEAVRRAHAPLFFIQADNDRTTENTRVLFEELKASGKLGLRKIYPAVDIGPPPAGHTFGCVHPEVWGDDVFTFLDRYLQGTLH
jgi:carboxymethylenebutenolidase